MKNNQIMEIQALRGISIILVFLFHLNQEIFSFGYLGVDIFFVISGFIITKIIYQNLIEKKLSIRVFFISRFLRLMPALFFMIIFVSFIIIATYQLHADPNILINTGLSSVVGLSNYYLIFIENDYFNSFDEIMRECKDKKDLSCLNIPKRSVRYRTPEEGGSQFFKNLSLW